MGISQWSVENIRDFSNTKTFRIFVVFIWQLVSKSNRVDTAKPILLYMTINGELVTLAHFYMAALDLVNMLLTKYIF